jgi:hypothetical protein
MGTSAGKRMRERQKVDKARTKATRKAERQTIDLGPVESSTQRSEVELMDDLGILHRSFEAGDLSPEDFEERRDQIQAEFEQLSGTNHRRTSLQGSAGSGSHSA